MKAASSLARNATIPAQSSGWPMRPSGTPLTMASRIFCPCSPVPTKDAIAGVSVGPGQMVLTVTFARDSSRASALAKAMVAPLQPE